MSDLVVMSVIQRVDVSRLLQAHQEQTGENVRFIIKIS